MREGRAVTLQHKSMDIREIIAPQVKMFLSKCMSAASISCVMNQQNAQARPLGLKSKDCKS